MSRESHAALTVIEVPQGSTGSYLVLTFKNNGAALNLSSATGAKQYSAKTTAGAAVATDVAAAWFTDGTDGKVKVQLTAALVTAAPRDLLMHGEVVGFNGGTLVSRLFILRVVPNAKGT